MKLLHLSDLHLGKRMNDFSMIEDQEYILKKILKICDSEMIQGVIIAGDMYDKTTPPAEAVMLLDSFLTALQRRGLKVFIISGNHDSAERLAFGGRIIEESGIYVSPVYNGKIEPITLEENNIKTDIWMLPFLKPANVRKLFPDAEINSYTDAMKTAVDEMKIDKSRCNILVTHQFVTGAFRCDSEDVTVGGTDNVDAAVFNDFDYVALGHIHNAQSVTRETIRYCGTPLKYSFSEANQEKSATIIEIGETGEISIQKVKLNPLHDVRDVKGKYEEVMLKENYSNTNVEDYIRVTLTDEEDIPNAISKLRTVYPNIMKLQYDNQRTRNNNAITNIEQIKEKQPIELFEDLYRKQNNNELTEQQQDFVGKLIEKLEEGRR